ncbi:MAG: type II secretion system protein [Candidatus Zapsychrus exili]|nr:type II secretion system protein [Candidatus Zapsychrus exili]
MKKRGFTIIELLVVIAVISILVGIAVPRIKGMQDEANRVKAEAEAKTIQTAIESYYINQKPSSYPDSSTTICATTLNSASPLIVSDVLYDPFLAAATEYNYIKSTNGKYYIIFSVGVDGVADITGIGTTGTLTGVDDDDVYVSNGTGF